MQSVAWGIMSVAGVLRGLERDPGPHLIVTPASLLENWQRELRRWAPGLRVQPYFGRERQAVRAELTSWRCAAGMDGASMAVCARSCGSNLPAVTAPVLVAAA